MKTCFKCGVKKEPREFYRHPRMADGRLNKCKACTKQDVATHRAENIERIREYDRRRGARQTPEYLRKYRKENPDKCRARTAVMTALRSGRLKRQPCEVCGATDRIHAHHDDYSSPLDVRWLCAAHHAQHHARQRSA